MSSMGAAAPLIEEPPEGCPSAPASPSGDEIHVLKGPTGASCACAGAPDKNDVFKCIGQQPSDARWGMCYVEGSLAMASLNICFAGKSILGIMARRRNAGVVLSVVGRKCA